MADTAPVAAPAAAKPAKKKVASKPKKPADHPKYSEMIKAAIANLKERGGSSRQKILKYIMANYKVADEKTVNTHLKMALKAGVKSNALKQSKGTGASGSFRLGESAKKAAPKLKKVKKPKAAKPKSPKKAKSAKPKAKKPAAKKPAAKKAVKPKKPAAKKSPKKVKAAKPKAAKPKTAKPKTKKSPKKAAAKK
ncbi:histone H1-delta-like [Liolophura sinensis]|uniref:histone H1-delta-like n=1 Tax=Liolophura sinensis TaxID=3198878 RepID=UPI0031595D4A